MTPDRVAASIASFDFLYLTELTRLKVVAPTVRARDATLDEAQQGGHVLEPVAGLHRDVWVFDFRSYIPVSFVPSTSIQCHMSRIRRRTAA